MIEVSSLSTSTCTKAIEDENELGDHGRFFQGVSHRGRDAEVNEHFPHKEGEGHSRTVELNRVGVVPSRKLTWVTSTPSTPAGLR